MPYKLGFIKTLNYRSDTRRDPPFPDSLYSCSIDFLLLLSRIYLLIVLIPFTSRNILLLCEKYRSRFARIYLERHKALYFFQLWVHPTDSLFFNILGRQLFLEKVMALHKPCHNYCRKRHSSESPRSLQT